MWFRCWPLSQDISMCSSVPSRHVAEMSWCCQALNWTSCLFLLQHHMGVCSSTCARPPLFASLFYLKLTQEEIGSNCGGCCFLSIKCFIYNHFLILSLNGKENSTANSFSPSHLFKHFKCHISSVTQNGTFHSHAPAGTVCYAIGLNMGCNWV